MHRDAVPDRSHSRRHRAALNGAPPPALDEMASRYQLPPLRIAIRKANKVCASSIELNQQEPVALVNQGKKSEVK